MSGSGIYAQEWTDCGCPPSGSVDPQGNYYRAVEHNPATKDDFLNAVEADKFLKAPLCDRLAVSMLNTWDGAVHHLKLFTFKADWFIATASLTPAHGKIKDTPSKKQPAHTDWWPFSSVVRESAVTNVRKP